MNAALGEKVRSIGGTFKPSVDINPNFGIISALKVLM